MRSQVVPDVVSRFPQTYNPLAHSPPDAHLPLGRSRNTRVCTTSSCASITQSTFVDHPTPPQVPQYCIPDTLAFKTSLSPLISGLHRAAPFFEPCYVSHLVRVHHPCLSPHGTLSFSQVPACRRQRTVRDGCSSLRYSKPEKRFRMPAALLYTKSSFPGNVSIISACNQASQPSPRHPICAARNNASSCSMPCLELHLTARSCSCCSCLLPCLKAT